MVDKDQLKCTFIIHTQPYYALQGIDGVIYKGSTIYYLVPTFYDTTLDFQSKWCITRIKKLSKEEVGGRISIRIRSSQFWLSLKVAM